MPVTNVAKSATALAARAPKLSSRLGGFHLIMVAAFALLGFYVCFNQIKALKIDVISLKAMIHDSQRFKAPGLAEPRAAGGLGHTVEEFASPKTFADPGQLPVHPSIDDFDIIESIDSEEIHDAGLRDMLSGLVHAASSGPATGGVTIVVGNEDVVGGVVADIQEIAEEEAADGYPPEVVNNAVDNLENLNVKDLKTLASEKGISLKGGIKKADIIALIRDAEYSE